MFLKILLIAFGLFLFIVLAIVVALLVLRAKFRKFVKNLAAEGGSSADETPLRIQLRPAPDHSWGTVGEIARHRAVFLQNGLQEAGTFTISNIPGIALQAFADPARSAYAVVYEHPTVGIWMDIYTRFADDSSVTYSNAKTAGLLDSPPGHEKKRFPAEAAPEEIVADFYATRPSKPAEPHTVEEFARRFEKAYYEDMVWRAQRGGATREEIERVAAQMDTPVDPASIDLAQEELRSQAARQLKEDASSGRAPSSTGTT